jgi:phage shock protein B
MDDNLTGIIIALGCTLGPIWLVMHYKYKNRMAGGLTSNDAAMLEQITAVAQRLEQRVATLERILDAEVPAWRGNAYPNAGQQDGMYNRQTG